MDTPPPDVTILLPAYNEAEAIAQVIAEVRAVLDGADIAHEILVVDDCSTDGTAQLAADAGARVERHAMNLGSGAARRTGILAARGRIVVMMDADGSYDPATIPEMLRHFPAFDQVNGARDREMGTLRPLRASAKWVIRKIAEYLAGRRIPDLNTGLKAFKRDVMLQYLWVLPDGFSCVTTMTLAFLTAGHPVHYVPTVYRRRIGQSKFRPVRDTANYLHTVLRMITFFRPMRVYGPVALLLLGIGAFMSAYHVFGRPDKPSLEESDIVLLCAGIIVGAIGLLADLIVASRRHPGVPR